ncbi:MAG: carboxypeptidase-like regulatory domain-containing protein, partial [Chitinophagaceae bacterium]|nr:carboxypeptidase-like regulatory domain-containing protein [Chitinophagaceae bacterium]
MPYHYITQTMNRKTTLNYLSRISLILLMAVCSLQASAQDKHTVSGTVKAKASGETLIGAIVKLNGAESTGTVTNEYGFYSVTMPTGEYTLSVSYLGYAISEQKISLDKDVTQDIALTDERQTMEEVVIKSEREDANVSRSEMGVVKLDIRTANKLPVIMGEKDILKTIQLMPGVSSAGDGNSGFYVRGGSADQNLILLDEAPVYNASHLLGFFSTFNSDAIKDVTVYKGSIPAEYGGRLSSVLDIKMNEGNNQKYHVSGGIGLISSKLNVEGPIQKGKILFLVRERRTYADMFLIL